MAPRANWKGFLRLHENLRLFAVNRSTRMLLRARCDLMVLISAPGTQLTISVRPKPR